MNPKDLINNSNLEQIASQGSLIYEEVKSVYEANSIGKFLAIDIGSKEKYLGASSAEALVQARDAHPGHIFYVVKIGFDAAETMARLVSTK